MNRVVIFWGFLALVAISSPQHSLAAAEPSENLLPSNTKGFLSVRDLDALQGSWDKTQLGQLAADPNMKPFVDSLRDQIRSGGKQRLARLNLTWDDLRKVPTGEVAVAVTWDAPPPAKPGERAVGQASLVTLADITGNRKAADDLVATMVGGLKKQGAKPAKSQRDDVLLYVLPPRAGEKEVRQTAIFVNDDLLVVGDRAEVVEDIAAAAGRGRKNSLANQEAFASVMKSAARESKDIQGHLRWFIEPFGYADAARALNPPRERRRGKDMRKVLANQGFTAVQGFGGYLNFGLDNLDVLHRVAVFAPPVEGAKTKYEAGARMLNFPNAEYAAPPSFVPDDVSSYLSGSWDLKEAFEGGGALVDEMADEPGTFESVLESLELDRSGPKVNLRKELVAHLGTRVTMFTDYVEPIDENSERLLFAVEVDDAKSVAEAIRKSMEADPGVKRREVGEHVVWEIVEERMELPAVDIDNGSAGNIEHADRKRRRSGRRAAAEEEEFVEERILPNGAITVATAKDGAGDERSYLMVASHIDLLEKVLKSKNGKSPLASSSDYQAVMKQMESMGSESASFRGFTRTAEANRPTYEMLREGALPKSESLLGRALNGLLGDDRPDASTRKAEIDGTKLPKFETVRDSFAPAGMFVQTEAEGWMIIGFTLREQNAK